MNEIEKDEKTEEFRIQISYIRFKQLKYPKIPPPKINTKNE